ncbi:MAG TPA: ABC transporter ATP-binding protein, partial [Firmicutes bacterium]|nr:ABC transporter ATP-binding protein [Bacillota bacterium]
MAEPRTLQPPLMGPEPSTAPPLLVVEDLRTQFQVRSGTVYAVDGASFTVGRGEAMGLVGESGCGKTTAALSIVRLLPSNGKVTGGCITLDGQDLLALREEELRRIRWKKVSIIFQGAMNALNPVRRVGDQIGEAIMLHEGLDRRAARERTRALFEQVEIGSCRIDQYPHQFSGGMRQRVMIAMALACRPSLVIGDEPTTALDVMVQAQILELLENLRRELKMSLILITHDLSVVADTCDTVTIMYAGRVMEQGPLPLVFGHPAHPYTRALLQAFPDLNGRREMVSSIPGTPPNLQCPPPGCRFYERCRY